MVKRNALNGSSTRLKHLRGYVVLWVDKLAEQKALSV
jgi:hypothetical protein